MYHWKNFVVLFMKYILYLILIFQELWERVLYGRKKCQSKRDTHFVID